MLIALAVVSGATAQLAHSAEHASGMMPCDMDMSAADDTGAQPCKAITADCIKQMGCIADVGLPVRLAIAEEGAAFAVAAYWAALATLDGVVTTPEPLPPRAG